MEESIGQRSIRLENDLLSALGDHDIQRLTASLDTFQKTWTKLQHDIHPSDKTSTLDDATSAQLCGVASRVAVLSETFIDLESESKTFVSGLMSELDSIFPPASQPD